MRDLEIGTQQTPDTACHRKRNAEILSVPRKPTERSAKGNEHKLFKQFDYVIHYNANCKIDSRIQQMDIGDSVLSASDKDNFLRAGPTNRFGPSEWEWIDFMAVKFNCRADRREIRERRH